MPGQDPKGGSVAVRNRLARTEQLMGEHFSKRRIVKKLCEEYGLRPRQAWRYIRAIRRQWASYEVPPQRRAEIRAKLEELYGIAVNKGDTKGAAMVLKQLAELDGVNAPEQHEHYLAPAPIKVSSHEVDEAAQSLSEERRLKLVKGESE